MDFWQKTGNHGHFDSVEPTRPSRHLQLQRQALLTRLMLEAATEDKMRTICEKLMEKAVDGSLGAINLVFRLLMNKEALQLQQLAPAEPQETERSESSEMTEQPGSASRTVADSIRTGASGGSARVALSGLQAVVGARTGETAADRQLGSRGP